MPLILKVYTDISTVICQIKIRIYLQHTGSGGQLPDGIHRFDEPVSNITLKFCGGVPIDIAPK